MTRIGNDGKTIRDDANAKKIMTAVSCPNAANRGIGAKPIMANPTILDPADTTRATPVPLAARPEYHETGYGRCWVRDSAVEDEKRRVGCAGGSILPINQDYFLLYTEETFR